MPPLFRSTAPPPFGQIVVKTVLPLRPRSEHRTGAHEKRCLPVDVGLVGEVAVELGEVSSLGEVGERHCEE